jgi:hypothetical protein
MKFRFAFVCCLIRLCNAAVPAVSYISFNRTSAGPLTCANPTLLKYASDSDDSPFEEAKLPFPFQFFGQDFDRLYVSPNGAVDTSNTPCDTSRNCFFSTAHSGVISPLMLDFNAGASNSSIITKCEELDAVHFSFSNLTEYGQPNNTTRIFDFSCSIYSDGAILFKFNRIPTLGPSKSTKNWYSGIRPRPYWGSFVITDSQKNVASSSWNTSIPGVYPYLSDVRSSSDVYFCPVSTTWCLTPSVFYAADLPSSFSLTPLSSSCLNDVEIGYYVTGSPNAATACTASLLQGTYEYTCTLDGVPTLNGFNSIDIKLAWRDKKFPGSTFRALEVNPLEIDIVHFTSGGVNPYIYANSTNCTVNTDLCSSSPCGVCNADLTCLDLVCKTVDSVPDLYRNKSCENSCSSVYVEDEFGQCCNHGFIDCGGQCNGTAVPAFLIDHPWYQCCFDPVDCFGVCGGPGFFDSCGVCRRPGETGPECPTYFEVNTGYADGGAYVYYDAIASSDKRNASVDYTLNIKNTNETTVLFSFSLLKGDNKLVPQVGLPTGEFSLSGNSDVNISFGSSIYEMLKGNVTKWDVKTIRITFYRPSVYSYKLSLDVKLFPATRNCHAITVDKTCMDLPGCILCYQPGYRVLLAQEEIRNCSADVSADGSTLNASCSRSLFSDVVPGSLNQNPGDDVNKRGICQDGFRTTDCTVFSYSNLNGETEMSSLHHILIGAGLFVGIYSAFYVVYGGKCFSC